MRIIVLIGEKEQYDLYPSMLSLLAAESGITVHIAEIDDDITPAVKINNIANLTDNFAIFLIAIEKQ